LDHGSQNAIVVPGENDLYVEFFWLNWALGAATGSGPYSVATFYTTILADYDGHTAYVQDGSADTTTLCTSTNVYSDGANRIMLPYRSLGEVILYWVLRPLMQGTCTDEEFSWYKFIIRLTAL
jgi:hypothetical protein